MNETRATVGYDAEATFYDYTWDNLREDVAFYLRRLEGAHRILDAMCGTGRVAIALARAGHTVDGVDSSAGMLRRARQKTRKEPLNVRRRLHWHRGDLRKVKLGRGYEGAIIAVNSYGLMLSARDRIRALRQIHAGLRPGGQLILAIDSVRSYRRIQDGVPFVSFTRVLDSLGRIYARVMAESGSKSPRVTSSTLHLVIDGSGKVERSQVVRTITAVLSPDVVRAELRRGGFRPERLFGGYDERSYSALGDQFIIEAIAE